MARSFRPRCVLLSAGLCVAAVALTSCASSGSDAGSTRSADAATGVVEGDAACAMQSVRAVRDRPKPVDVIFVIDNSGSMGEEIAAVRENINRDFAEIIAQSGVDYRVILISRYGTEDTGICIAPPLAAASCGAGLAATRSQVFYHYDQDVGSQDAFCLLLETFDRADAAGHAPDGWQAWLRPDAQKALVVITDDSARCSYRHGDDIAIELGSDGADPFADALAFHSALLARSGLQFGVAPDIKYQFFSIVGMAAGERATEPLFPYQGLNSRPCDTAPGPGLSYQALSIVTDALRYPVCEGRSFDAIFQVLARSVIQASKTDCLFELPDAPEWQTIDRSTVNLEYRPGDGAAVRRFAQVRSPAACKDDHSFFIGSRIELCPSACNLIQADPTPAIDIRYGCSAIPQ